MNDKPHDTKLWCPSMCYGLFGGATEYDLQVITTGQRIREFSGSMRPMLALIRSCWTLSEDAQKPKNVQLMSHDLSWNILRYYLAAHQKLSNIPSLPAVHIREHDVAVSIVKQETFLRFWSMWIPMNRIGEENLLISNPSVNLLCPTLRSVSIQRENCKLHRWLLSYPMSV